MIKCEICGKKLVILNNFHLRMHGLSIQQYTQMFPFAILVDKSKWIKRYTEERNQKISIKMMGNKNSKGLVAGSEAAKRMRLKNIGSKRTLEAKQKMSLVQMGNKNSLGRVLTEESKKKMSVSHLGKKQSNETKAKKSDTAKYNFLIGKNIPPFPKNLSYQNDIGHHVRSSWEAGFIRVLNSFGINYEYESKRCRFYLGNLGTLVIDFYIPDFDIYVEVKGYLTDGSRKKWETFINMYPYIIDKVKVVDKQMYKLLENKYACSRH